MVNYEMLAIERAEVQLAINRLIAMTRMTRPDPVGASQNLLHLVKLVRRHLARAEPMVYATAAAARGGSASARRGGGTRRSAQCAPLTLKNKQRV